jgi:hypothetical protein
VQTNAGSSNTSAPRSIFGKQFLALSGTGAVSQSATFAGGNYVAVAQVAQGGVKVLLDGVQVGKLSASTLDFREVMSLPFVVTTGSHSVGLSVDTAFAPATPKLDEFRLLRVDVPPAVSITAPANGAVFQTGATVNVTATASDPDGLSALTLSRTPAGGAASQLATSASSPLSTSWSNSSANTYTITASATDSTGATSATSINIRVNANPSAVVSITPAGPVVTPATPGAAVAATVTVSSATDSDGSITKVEFLQDGTVVSSCTKTIPPAVAPFTCALPLPPRAVAYSLTVRVTDNDGGVTLTTPLTLRINTAPAVTLSAACVAPCIAPGTVNLTASPTDTDGSISKVEFYDGTTLLSSKTVSPWTYSHTAVTAATHSYTAKAFDNDNASTTSTAQAVTVTAPVPAVALTAACTAPCSAPAAVVLTAVPANITDTISKVEFYDGTTLLSTDTTSPYSFAAVSVAAASHSYTAKMYVTGTTAAVATSSAQVVNVNALPTVALAVSCIAPCVAPATINLTATPADADGTISKVELYDGATLLTSKTASPWTYSHTSVTASAHSYTAKAFDNNNASATSAAQSVTVSASAPTVTLSVTCAAPCNAPATVTLTAVPANIVGTVSKVEFYDGATLLNTDTTGPYSFAAASVSAATHSYTAKVYVTGTAAAVGTSAAQVVRPNALPTVTITAACVAPCAALATVNLTAIPADTDGTIGKVEFFDGSTLLTTKTAAPWEFAHATAAAGSRSYKAKAFDNDGASTTSSVKSITVAATAPSMSLVAVCIAPCVAPATITLTATPANVIAPIDSIRFFDGPMDIKYQSQPPSPYTHTLSNVAPGEHRYTASALLSDANSTVINTTEQVMLVGGPAAAVTLTATCADYCSAPTVVTLTATATGLSAAYCADLYTSPCKAIFFIDGAYLDQIASPPYTLQRWPVLGGNHTYQVRMVHSESSNVVATSGIVAVAVAEPVNAAPLVAWIQPDGGEINTLGSFVFRVSASATVGAVASVRLYANNVFIGTATLLAQQSGIYEYIWTPQAQGQAAGTYTITAVVIDAQGASASSSPRTLGVSSAITFTLPQLAVVYAAANDSAQFSIPVVVSPKPEDLVRPWQYWNFNTDVFIPWTVELLENGVAVASQKYGYEKFLIPDEPGCQWYNATRCVKYWPITDFVRSQMAIGTYQYSLRITKAPGVIWQSEAWTVTVAGSTPVVTVISPSAGGTLYQGGMTLALRVVPPQANGTVGQFKEGAVIVRSCTFAASACVADWSNASLGSHTIVATVTDALGRSGSSVPVTFEVAANASPTISLTSPAYGARFHEPASFDLVAVAADSDGSITKVEFFNREQNLLGQGTLINGQYKLLVDNVMASDRLRQFFYAKATDNHGVGSTWAYGNVLVVGPPTVSAIADCDSRCFLGQHRLGISSNYLPAELARVRFLKNGVEVASLTAEPFEFIDPILQVGTHTYQAEIVTVFGATVQSAIIERTFTIAAPPQIALTSPADGASFLNTVSVVTVRAVATKGWFALQQPLNLYVDGTRRLAGFNRCAGSIFSAITCEADLTDLGVGTHRLTATVADETGTVVESLPITLTILGGPNAASIASPITGSEFPASTTITVTASGGSGGATNPDPNITRIELWRVGTGVSGTDELLTSVTGNTLAYALTLPATSSAVGLYTHAFNAAGGRTRSTTTTIIARADNPGAQYFVWTNLNAALKAGNKAAAMAFLTPTAQANYGSALNVMVSQATLVVLNGLSGFMQISLTVDTADYLVALDANGVRFLYGLRFVLMDDGQWKLESM